MNVIWRTILSHLSSHRRLRRGERLVPNGVSSIRLRVLPTDIDVIGHMNNGRYLSLFDLGRWDLLVRTGMADAARQHGWYPVAAAATITFRKSLGLWARFELQSRMTGHDERSFFIEHRAVLGGEVYARAIIRAKILRRGGGVVPAAEVLAALEGEASFGEVAGWVRDWAAASALPPTKAPAPSDWD